jgi:hypothetical protein
MHTSRCGVADKTTSLRPVSSDDRRWTLTDDDSAPSVWRDVVDSRESTLADSQ